MATSSIDLDQRDAASPGPVRIPEDGVPGPYRLLLERLSWPGNSTSPPVRTLGLTSCSGGQGVSTIAAHLAVAASQSGNHAVLLVDANPARPSVHQTFGASSTPGLGEVLLDEVGLAAVLQPSPVPNLSVLAAGSVDPQALRGRDPDALTRLVETLQEDFALVVFDLPAVVSSHFPSRLASLLDGVLLVVEADGTPWEVVQRQQELLTQTRVCLVGAVLNQRRHPLTH